MSLASHWMTSSLCLGEMATSCWRKNKLFLHTKSEKTKHFTSAGVTQHGNEGSVGKGEPQTSLNHHFVLAVTYSVPRNVPRKRQLSLQQHPASLRCYCVLATGAKMACRFSGTSNTDSVSSSVALRDFFFFFRATQIHSKARLEQNQPCSGSQVGAQLLADTRGEGLSGYFKRKGLFILQITGIFLAQYMLKKENSKQFTKDL